MPKNIIQRRYFRTPFSRDYWYQAFSELKNTRSLVFAALILALRIAMKPLKIPIAADVNITFGFIVNSFGSMVYGPVVALLGGALSDTIGYLVAPSGPYFFWFIVPEMLGSFIFALFLYSTDITPVRLILSKFCVNLFANIVISEPIMILYYERFLTTAYQPFLLVRIVKNIVMLPIEAIILMIVFRTLIPALARVGFNPPGKVELDYTKKHILLLAALLVTGAAAVTGYGIYSYNTTSLSGSYTPEERLARNRAIEAYVLENHQDLNADRVVTVIESAVPKAFHPDVTYQVAVYAADVSGAENPEDLMTELEGLSKSKAAKREELTLLFKEEIVLTDEHAREPEKADK
jgi:ECF transporter S component (folate family)